MRMLTQELPIQRANPGEVYGDQVAFNSDDFEAKLHKYGVKDLFDTKLAIKQDKEKYIFAINGENKFAVNGKVDFASFIQDFYKKLAENEKRGAEKQAVITVSELEKKTKIEITITETAKDLTELKDQIQKNEKMSEKATDLLNVKYKLNRLITFFEQEKKQEPRSGQDKQLRKTQRVEIKRRLEELYKIQRAIEQLEKNKEKTYKRNVKMDDINDLDMKITLKQFSDRIEELGKEAPNFIMTRNEIIKEEGDTTPYNELIINNVSDAKKINKSLRKINNKYAILDKTSLTVAERQEVSQDLQALELYLNNVINHPDDYRPSEHPFVPTHLKEFCALAAVDPTLAAFMRLNKESGTIPSHNDNTTRYINESNTGIVEHRGGKEYNPSPYSDAKEAFEKGGINGVSKYRLDQTNMRPNQKQFWGGVGNLAVTGGLIFVGWKMLSSAFKMVFKSNRGTKGPDGKYTGGTGIYDGSNRARLGIPGALLFGAHARTGEGPLRIFTGGELTKKAANIFSRGDKDVETSNQTEQDKETHLKYTEGFQGATTLFNGLNYGEMKSFLVEEKGQMKIDPAKYDALLDMFKNGSKKNEGAAAFLESLGKNDEKHIINLGLTGMGVTRKELQNTNNKDKKFDKAKSEAIVRLYSVSDFMDKKGYNKINAETQYLVDKYIANGNDASDLEKLAKRGDVFYKEIDIVDKTGLAPQIKTLAKGDTEREEALLLAINTFYDKMPNAPKNIEISGTRPEIKLTTYDQTSTINLQKKELIGFSPSPLSSYYELFKAANLTNYIKKVCKDKEAKSDKPFYISKLGRDITFDEAKLFSTDFDTEVVSAGRGGSLNDISPTLENNKQAYCDYLNSLKFRKEAPTTTK